MPATSDELEIFVFTAANSKAQENLLKSIKNPIRPESIVYDGFKNMSEVLRNELDRIKNTAGGFYAWGAEPRGHADSTWRKMARGDYVLAYYAKGFHYVARVLASFMSHPWRRVYGARAKVLETPGSTCISSQSR
jgi:hypothetical protein